MKYWASRVELFREIPTHTLGHCSSGERKTTEHLQHARVFARTENAIYSEEKSRVTQHVSGHSFSNRTHVNTRSVSIRRRRRERSRRESETEGQRVVNAVLPTLKKTSTTCWIRVAKMCDFFIIIDYFSSIGHIYFIGETVRWICFSSFYNLRPFCSLFYLKIWKTWKHLLCIYGSLPVGAISTEIRI